MGKRSKAVERAVALVSATVVFSLIGTGVAMADPYPVLVDEAGLGTDIYGWVN